jgi:hypothetical protein
MSPTARIRESEVHPSGHVVVRAQEANGIETAETQTHAVASAETQTHAVASADPHTPVALQEECTAPLAALAWSEMVTDWQVLYVRVESKEERRRVKVRAAELGFDSYADYVRALIDVDLDKAERADRRRVRR